MDFFKEDDCNISFGGFLSAAPLAKPIRGITIARANELLKERGRAVTGMVEREYGSVEFYSGQYLREEPTHRALLVCIEPIARDTAEDLLKEITKSSRVLGFESDFNMDKWLERARKVLEAK
jgi:hypothetical protein